LTPSTGSLTVLDEQPASSAEQLGRIGFVAQDTPVYSGLSIAAHLQMGAALNSNWDAPLANRRIRDLGLDPSQRAGRLSGGPRAQLALTLAMAKRPSLLLLDEPVASLDPLARREFLAILMEVVAEHNVSVILSSHLVADLERVCDYLVVLAASRVQVNGEIEELLSTHHRLIGPRRELDSFPDTVRVIESSHTERQTTATVRCVDPILDPTWSVESLSMEDLVLAYMGQAEEQRRELVRSKGSAQ
jgi:ABC-2 type transport system ATP-binding protein